MPTPVYARPGPDVLRLVQLNCQRLYSRQSVLVGEFQQTLHRLVPELHRLSPDAERYLAEQLVGSVLWSALSQEPEPEIEQALQRVGGDSHRQGFPRDGYLGVGHALLRSARTVSDSGWSSELSSAWVAYFAWLAEQLRAGADVAELTPSTAPQASAAGPGGSAGPGGRPDTLDDVLAGLRAQHFAADPRGLDAICTRVMLRTGADLRDPRPDQRADPDVLSDVMMILTIMGYAPSSAPATPSAATPATAFSSAPPTAPAAPRRPTSLHAAPAAAAGRSRWSLRRFTLFRRRETR